MLSHSTPMSPLFQACLLLDQHLNWSIPLETHGPAAGWPADAPLNATFWHKVTEAMAQNSSLVTLHNSYQGKLSTQTPNCTSAACTAAKICYMRSGSVALGSQCPQG
jgi:hypothetical protein